MSIFCGKIAVSTASRKEIVERESKAEAVGDSSTSRAIVQTRVYEANAQTYSSSVPQNSNPDPVLECVKNGTWREERGKPRTCERPEKPLV